MRALDRPLTDAERAYIRLAAERVAGWWHPGDEDALGRDLASAGYANVKADSQYIVAVGPDRALSLLDEVDRLKTQVNELRRDLNREKLDASAGRGVARANAEEARELRRDIENHSRTAEGTIAALHRSLLAARSDAECAQAEVARLGQVVDQTRAALTVDDFTAIHGEDLPFMARRMAESRQGWRAVAQKAVDGNAPLLEQNRKLSEALDQAGSPNWPANLAAGIAFAAAMREADEGGMALRLAILGMERTQGEAAHDLRAFSRSRDAMRFWFSR